MVRNAGNFSMISFSVDPSKAAELKTTSTLSAIEPISAVPPASDGR